MRANVTGRRLPEQDRDGGDVPQGTSRTEAAEYRHYIGYLQKLGYLTRDVEELGHDELQGAQGLRALRVTVDLERFPADPSSRRRAAVDGA